MRIAPTLHTTFRLLSRCLGVWSVRICGIPCRTEVIHQCMGCSSAHAVPLTLQTVLYTKLKVQIAHLIVEQLKRPLYVPALPGQVSCQFWSPRWWSELPITVRNPAHHPTQNEDTSLQNAKWLHWPLVDIFSSFGFPFGTIICYMYSCVVVFTFVAHSANCWLVRLTLRYSLIINGPL